LVWLVMCTASYYAAVYISLNLTGEGGLDGTLQGYGAFFLAGLVGATLMLTSFSLMIQSISLLEITLLSILGGVLGESFFIGTFIPLYLIWQTGMLLSLAYLIQRNNQIIVPTDTQSTTS
jgi:hypothetical protein